MSLKLAWKFKETAIIEKYQIANDKSFFLKFTIIIRFPTNLNSIIIQIGSATVFIQGFQLNKAGLKTFSLS